MKNISFLALALLTAGATASAQSETAPSSRVELYAQASAVVAFPGDFDTAVGGGLAVGVLLDKVHSLQVEAIRFKSADNYEDVTFTPILATYKYGIPLTPKLTLKVGGSLGATKERSEWYRHGTFLFGGGYWVKQSDTAFTYGVTGGVSYAFTDHVSFDASAYTLGMEKTSLTTAGAMVLVTAGVSFRF